MSTIGVDERRAPNTSIEISCRMIIAAGYIAVIVVVVLALILTMQRRLMYFPTDGCRRPERSA
jgi:hypothetical protein